MDVDTSVAKGNRRQPPETYDEDGQLVEAPSVRFVRECREDGSTRFRVFVWDEESGWVERRDAGEVQDG